MDTKNEKAIVDNTVYAIGHILGMATTCTVVGAAIRTRNFHGLAARMPAYGGLLLGWKAGDYATDALRDMLGIAAKDPLVNNAVDWTKQKVQDVKNYAQDKVEDSTEQQGDEA